MQSLFFALNQDGYILFEFHLMDICYENYDMYEYSYYAYRLNFAIEWLYFFLWLPQAIATIHFRLPQVSTTKQSFVEIKYRHETKLC